MLRIGGGSQGVLRGFVQIEGVMEIEGVVKRIHDL